MLKQLICLVCRVVGGTCTCALQASVACAKKGKVPSAKDPSVCVLVTGREAISFEEYVYTPPICTPKPRLKSVALT